MLQSILGFFIKKIACLQTLEVICTYAWKNNSGEGGYFLLNNKLQPKTIYVCLDR